MRVFNTIDEAYLGALDDVYNRPEYRCAPRGQAIREILDYTFKVLNPVSKPIETKDAKRNSVIAEYTSKEIDLYNSCSNKVEDFAKASKFWEKLANPDGTVNSAYGYLIWKNKSCGNPYFEADLVKHPTTLDYCFRTPWEWAKQCLLADKDTRQAIMRFNLPTHNWMGNKDQVCTLHANWLIRDDKLNLTVIMRSNDLTLGLVYDLSWFISLMDKMLAELRGKYPELSKGTYTHMAHSMHIYDRDEDKVRKMLGLAAN